MMEREKAKVFAKTFIKPQLKASHTLRFFIAACDAEKKLYPFYPTSDPSLDFC